MYTHKKDLPLNNLQVLICHNIQPNQTLVALMEIFSSIDYRILIW